MTGDGINHGTYGGYQKHRKLGVEACAECLAAQVWYTRRRRESAEERRQTAARTRAYVRISRAYPTLYHALYEEELGRTT